MLPIDTEKISKILVTGDFVTEIARGQGSAAVEGYNTVSLLDALKEKFGSSIEYVESPGDEQIKDADLIILSIGTIDEEGMDSPFSLPDETENKILNIAEKNPNVVVIVNTGRGIKMTDWNNKVPAILYAWYPGQNGNIAIAEILSGKVNPSGKLPITIEKRLEC